MKTAAEQHLYHRLKSRYGLVVKREDILNLKKMIVSGKSEPIAFTSCRSRLIHHIYYNNCHLYLVYEYTSKEIVTCLTKAMVSKKSKSEHWKIW